MNRILVTGASGQLGQEFNRIAEEEGASNFVFWNRQSGDITNPRTFDELRLLKPNVVINCAAYTAVDLAESHRKAAFATNAEAVHRLALTTKAMGIPVIHFSSDYVYHNYLRRPLRESDPERPKGVYARSKLQGEKLLMEAHGFPLIFRVSWLYSVYGHNFPKTILRLASQRDSINVVRDQVGAPTHARDLALAICNIVKAERSPTDWKRISGVYNYSNEGITNWAEIAQFIVNTIGSTCTVNPIVSKEFPTAAPRPRYSKLNLSKFKETFNADIRLWRDSMRDCLVALQTKDQ